MNHKPGKQSERKLITNYTGQQSVRKSYFLATTSYHSLAIIVQRLNNTIQLKKILVQGRGGGGVWKKHPLCLSVWKKIFQHPSLPPQKSNGSPKMARATPVGYGFIHSIAVFGIKRAYYFLSLSDSMEA